MARKGRRVEHTYKLRHMDKWKELMKPETKKPKSEAKPEEGEKVKLKNINELWEWDTLKDVQ